jgi:hypothetical protein
MRFPGVLACSMTLALLGCEPAASTTKATPPAGDGVPTKNAGLATPADPVDAAVAQIRARFATIERELPSYRCRTLELDGFSAEGGELRACYARDQLRKMTARFYGESGRAETQFFVWDQHVDFVFEVSERYTAPLSGAVSAREEQRYYFVADQLVRWLGPGNTPQPVTGAAAQEAVTQLQATARQFAACALDARVETCAA